MTKRINRCEICGRHKAKLVVDHNHYTGKIRGRLCYSCNTALGLFQDDYNILESAQDYLLEKGSYAKRNLKRAGVDETDGD